MKMNLVFIIGIALLAFSALAYYGNFVQWSSSTQVTATITSATEQWVRRGGGSVKVDIRYSAGGSAQSGNVTLSKSTMEDAANNGEIEVVYMNEEPERVIPAAVLKKKQKSVPFMAGAGVLLTIVGVGLSLRKKGAEPVVE